MLLDVGGAAAVWTVWLGDAINAGSSVAMVGCTVDPGGAGIAGVDPVGVAIGNCPGAAVVGAGPAGETNGGSGVVWPDPVGAAAGAVLAVAGAEVDSTAVAVMGVG